MKNSTETPIKITNQKHGFVDFRDKNKEMVPVKSNNLWSPNNSIHYNNVEYTKYWSTDSNQLTQYSPMTFRRYQLCQCLQRLLRAIFLKRYKYLGLNKLTNRKLSENTNPSSNKLLHNFISCPQMHAQHYTNLPDEKGIIRLCWPEAVKCCPRAKG